MFISTRLLLGAFIWRHVAAQTKPPPTIDLDPNDDPDLKELSERNNNGTLSWYFGEERAKYGLAKLAGALGATKDTAGGMMDYSLSTSNPPGYGGSAPHREEVRVRSSIPGAKAITLRYGPYTVPNTRVNNSLGEFGMMADVPRNNLQKPCDGKCTIVGYSAGLEFLNGTEANINKGLWLHHLVLFNIGPGRKDFTCGGDDVDISVPHVTIGATARQSERFYGVGNERTEAIFSKWGVTDAGYKINPEDKFGALVELMNENAEDRVVWLTVTYDIVDGHPFKDEIKTVWLDVRQCGTSQVNPPKKIFDMAYNWTSNFNGEYIGANTHVHDGGTHLSVHIRDTMVCDSVSIYGGKPQYISHASGHGGHAAMGEMKHISEQPICDGSKTAAKAIKKGDKLGIKAYYDLEKYPGMQREDKTLDEVMAIAGMFVRIKGT